MNPTFSLLFTLFLPLFCPQYPAFLCDSVPNTAQNCSTIDSFKLALGKTFKVGSIVLAASIMDK